MYVCGSLLNNFPLILERGNVKNALMHLITVFIMICSPTTCIMYMYIQCIMENTNTILHTCIIC